MQEKLKKFKFLVSTLSGPLLPCWPVLDYGQSGFYSDFIISSCPASPLPSPCCVFLPSVPCLRIFLLVLQVLLMCFFLLQILKVWWFLLSWSPLAGVARAALDYHQSVRRRNNRRRGGEGLECINNPLI